MFACSLHGLVRGDNMELGRDSDTGGQVRLLIHQFRQPTDLISLGFQFSVQDSIFSVHRVVDRSLTSCFLQVKYVVEFARALALMPEVYRVDLLTRQICSPDVDWSYGEPTEMLGMGSYDDSEEAGESSGAYIVRIPCGPRYSFNVHLYILLLQQFED